MYCQTLGLVLRLRVDFVLPLSQEQEEPHLNLSDGGALEGWTKKILIGFWLSLGGKGSEWPRSQQRTNTTRRTPSKSTITEHTKNLIVAHRPCLLIVFLGPKIFLTQKLFFWLIYFRIKNLFWTQKIFRTNIFFFGPKTFIPVWSLEKAQ